MNAFLQTLSLGVSIFTLTALSGDCYTAIMDPMSIHKNNSQMRAMLIVSFIWMLSIALAIPDLLAANLQVYTYEGKGDKDQVRDRLL